MIFEVNEIPVSVNRMFQGRKIHTKEYAGYRELATKELWVQKCQRRHKLVDTYFGVKITFYMDTRRFKVCDIDNMTKALLDSGTEAGLWMDDKLISEIFSKKVSSRTNKTTIEIYEPSN